MSLRAASAVNRKGKSGQSNHHSRRSTNSFLRQLRRYLRTKAEIKRLYGVLDSLETEVIQTLLVQRHPVRLSKHSRQGVVVQDNFVDSNKAFRSHGISRFEVKVVDLMGRG